MPFVENGFYMRAISDQANDITQRFIKSITDHPYEIDTGQCIHGGDQRILEESIVRK